MSENTAGRQRAYAGIGSRETPDAMLELMQQTAAVLARRGWILRSGGAPGADTAFAQGADGRHAEIFLPWRGFRGVRGIDASALLAFPDAYEIAARTHPGWHKLSRAARALMTRNCFQVLGADLRSPVRFVLCWAKAHRCDAQGRICDVRGGTGQAVRLAYQHDIPVFHLGIAAHQARVQRFLEREAA